MSNYGYVRVSSKDQNEARQLVSLSGYGIPEENIYVDKQSGANFERPSYMKLLGKLKIGDVLFIKSIDRLGRNYEEILRQWRIITKEVQADIVVVDMPLLDTRKKEKDLTRTFIADLVLQILSYVAQSEREFIKKRQAEGIAAAKARGVQFGRKPLELSEDFNDICNSYIKGEISSRKAAEKLGISKSTFLRRVHQEKRNK